MALSRTSYSDDERARLRAALADYAAHYGLSVQELTNRIEAATGFALSGDAGRKRVERFLKGTHRQGDQLIEALVSFLGNIPPRDIEQSAATLAHFFSRPMGRKSDVEALAGRYLVWLSTDRRPETALGLTEMTAFDGFGFSAQPPRPMENKIAYAVLELRPLAKANALIASEAIINLRIDPEITSFPEILPQEHDAGVFVPFSYSERNIPRYLMTTRAVLETRLYRLYRASDAPLIFRGDLSLNSGIGRMLYMSHSDPLHPDFEVELVRIEDDDAAAPHLPHPQILS